MAHLRRILILLVVALALVLSALPAAADPLDTGEVLDVPANVTWE